MASLFPPPALPPISTSSSVAVRNSACFGVGSQMTAGSSVVAASTGQRQRACVRNLPELGLNRRSLRRDDDHAMYGLSLDAHMFLEYDERLAQQFDRLHFRHRVPGAACVQTSTQQHTDYISPA